MNQRKLLFCLTFSILCLAAQAQEEGIISYRPTLDGSVKVRLEVDVNDGSYRFNVRNTRFGVAGKASASMDYRLQIDFSNEGKLSVLDAYAGVKLEKFYFTLGQQGYLFSTDMARGPATTLFANRSFVSKYLTNYTSQELSGGNVKEVVRSLGSRDLGARVAYKPSKEHPVTFYLGAFSGVGVNNPRWNSTVNVIARGEYGRETGFRAAASYYEGSFAANTRVVAEGAMLKQESYAKHLRMVGGELRYNTKHYQIEGEYALRRLTQTNENLTAVFVQGYYRFFQSQSKVVKYIAPVARYDYGKGIDYQSSSSLSGRWDAQRLTCGVNIGFAEKWIKSEVRFNYETYFGVKATTAGQPDLRDMVTLELVAAF